MRFRNREHAGNLLADALSTRIHEPAILYALPRGGVALAAVIARRLQLPLDLVIPRKIGHPWQPEYGIGAVTENGEPVFNEEERRRADPAWLERAIAGQRSEARRRRELYSGGRPRTPAQGRCAILVDDGVATGLTLRAAVAEVRADRPARIVVAVGVAPPETAARFRNREHAGNLLADALSTRIHEPAILYALPRGGVALAAVIARRLQLPLDLVIPRKIGHPWQPEYGIGAVTENGEPVFNEEERQRADPAWLERAIAGQRNEARRRRELYSGGRPRTPAQGR
ncbi:MAG: phosphoribosyltransferase, partial [Gammaproteobacteria bacterium]